jgi:hypothetical protein
VLFHSVPFWAIFMGTLLLVLLSVEGGYSWARSRRRSAREKEREKEEVAPGSWTDFRAF